MPRILIKECIFWFAHSQNEVFKRIRVCLNNQSFISDIKLLQNHFHMDIKHIFENPEKLKAVIKSSFTERDGVTDSIKLCLKSLKIPIYHKMLNNLVRPIFLREYIDQVE